jgi:hypothetical protein
MKKSFLVLSSLAVLALAGCTNTSSPQAVLGTAGNALARNDFRTFRGTLTGDAAARYGSLAGMAELREQFAGAKNLTTGRVELLNISSHGVFTYKNYAVDVMSGDRRMMIASVNCTSEKRTIYHHEHTPPHEGTGGMDFETTQVLTSCLISQLN